MEKESAGVYLTGHPLSEYAKLIRRMNALEAGVIKESAENFSKGEDTAVPDGSYVTVCGIISEKKEKMTKSGQMMAFLNLEDMTSGLRIIVFPKVLAESENKIFEDAVVSVSGRINYRDDGTAELMAEKIGTLSPESNDPVIAKVKDLYVLDDINRAVKKHPGGRTFVIEHDGKYTETVYSVEPDGEFLAELLHFEIEIEGNA